MHVFHYRIVIHKVRNLQTNVSTWTQGSPHFGQDKPSLPEFPPFTPLPPLPGPDPVLFGSFPFPGSEEVGGGGGGGTGGVRPNKIPADENSVTKEKSMTKEKFLVCNDHSPPPS